MRFNHKISFLFFVVVVLGLQEASAQHSPKYSNDFLNIGVGARSFAMGQATVASVYDETAVYRNPAGLLGLSNPVNLGGMHSEHFAGLASYDFGVLAFKLNKKSAMGISLIRLAVDNIPNTTQLIDNNGNLRFDRITAFSAADYAITFSFARQLDIEGLSVGGNAKIIRRVAGNFAKASGFGLDFGAIYEMDNWRFAVMARDVTTTYNAWSFDLSELEEVFKLTGNAIPENSTEITLPQFIFGAAYQYTFATDFVLLGELNLAVTTDGQRNVLIKTDPLSIDPRIGVELGFKNMVFVRTGINNIQEEYRSDKSAYTTLQPNLGMGIKFSKFRFDYALTDVGDVSGAGLSHVFSLALSLEPKKK